MSGHCTLSAAVLSALAWRHTFSEGDFRQAFSRLAARRPGQKALEVSSAPIEPMDLPVEADYSSDLLIAPKHTGPIKVVSMNGEGNAYVALLECPIDSIDFHLKVSDGKPFEDPTDTKPCPICEFVLDPNGECVNHKCPNWIKE